MIILVKISEKSDHKLIISSCNIQNTLITSWFVTTILYKRVPKSLSSMQSHSKHNYLSWDLVLRTFTWSREAIVTRIICRFKELSLLTFMLNVETEKHRNVET